VAALHQDSLDHHQVALREAHLEVHLVVHPVVHQEVRQEDQGRSLDQEAHHLLDQGVLKGDLLAVTPRIDEAVLPGCTAGLRSFLSPPSG